MPVLRWAPHATALPRRWMPDGYGTHADYIGRIDEEIRNRQRDVEAALKHAFAGFLETRSVDVIVFSNGGAGPGSDLTLLTSDGTDGRGRASAGRAVAS